MKCICIRTYHGAQMNFSDTDDSIEVCKNGREEIRVEVQIYRDPICIHSVTLQRQPINDLLETCWNAQCLGQWLLTWLQIQNRALTLSYRQCHCSVESILASQVKAFACHHEGTPKYHSIRTDTLKLPGTSKGTVGMLGKAFPFPLKYTISFCYNEFLLQPLAMNIIIYRCSNKSRRAIWVMIQDSGPLSFMAQLPLITS